MKKIFTLLFCLVGMTLAANATDITPIENCINYLLVNHNNSHMLMANNMNANMDANHDGVINIHDVTTMINEMLRAQQADGANRAPADNVDINKLMKKVIESDEEPNINDVTDTINEQLRNK